MIKYTLKTHWKVEYVFAAGGRKITSVLTAKGIKLTLNRLVQVLMDLNRRLDGQDGVNLEI